MKSIWRGVIPAITTPFAEDMSVDYRTFGDHCELMAKAFCTGIVIGGSLGEGGSLTLDEKSRLIETANEAVGGRLNLFLGVAALTTSEAVETALMAATSGAQGLMVLPPYVYVGDWRETKAHVDAVCQATGLSCMLYNNPIAYKTDFLPEQVAELLDSNPNLHAIKESSAAIRRIAALRSLAEGRLDILVGVDDLIVESIAAGAVGWIAGLVNAFPRESVALFNQAKQGGYEEAFKLYKWFLPLLRMDIGPKFVHLIKLVQQEVLIGNERLRPPRMALVGAEREAALTTLRTALETRPGSEA
ncbi:MAG TPA: dihydrodipicolinate synthase family protein [Bryobacteraceae bacterium]|mgnify:CR=1 FL=1|nr:dihydrodipicolinate synthase family protein [Bryobacteraceae bacterium]HPT24790.1 dihydrodipicolinate synthase family protein [Bryobacteraceae bacterium]